jgi:tRNA 5-methylaminomethyl-2-thiouridine biosynthesis bifunctional protein
MHRRAHESLRAGPAADPSLAAADLPALWAGRRRFVVLDTGFDGGPRFLAAWRAWRSSGPAAGQLVYAAAQASLLAAPALALPETTRRGADADLDLDAAADAETAALRLVWPPPMPGLQLLDFDAGRVRLLLLLGSAAAGLARWRLRADVIFAPAAAPRLDLRRAKALARLAAPEAVLIVADASHDDLARHTGNVGGHAAGSGVHDAGSGSGSGAGAGAGTGAGTGARARHVGEAEAGDGAEFGAGAGAEAGARAGVVHDRGAGAGTTKPPGPGLHAALQSAGFAVDSADPAATVIRARYAPGFTPRRAPGPGVTARAPGHAVVVGAGVAGACAAAALARRGWVCEVLDTAPEPAAGASGNPAALFHGTVHAADGTHARFTRAAALHAQHAIAALLARGVPGRCDGLVRAHAGVDPGDIATGWAQRLAGAALQQLAPGLRADSAWFFPGGGWVDAVAAVHAWLATPGVRFRGRQTAAGLRRQAEGWAVLDAAGRRCASADIVVLANAFAPTNPAAAALMQSAGAAPWPAERVRGQVSWFATDAAPSRPVAGHGYAVAWPPGHCLCGATTQPGDAERAVRTADHAFNLERLRALTGIAPVPQALLQGRVAWRETAPDRLPVIGAAVRAEQPAASRPGAGCGASTSTSTSTSTSVATDSGPAWGAQTLRSLARVDGLFVIGALAGRGFTWGPLAGELLAALIEGAPLPLEADLVDAVDPARWFVRALRRRQ